MQSLNFGRFHLLLFFLLFGVFVSAQDNVSEGKHKIGILYGQGNQILFNVKYHYQVQLLQLQYNYNFYQRDGWNLEIMAQPQFNITKYRALDHIRDITTGYEFGLNAGLLIRNNVYKDILSVYAGISAGPHFISGAPKRQTEGFIFSDNFFVGLTARLDRNIYLDLRPGFRHISNANIVKPNRGINNLILNGGILVFIN